MSINVQTRIPNLLTTLLYSNHISSNGEYSSMLVRAASTYNKGIELPQNLFYQIAPEHLIYC